MGQQHNVRFHMLALKASETTQAYYEHFLKDKAEQKWPGHEFIAAVNSNETPFFWLSQPKVGPHKGKPRVRISYSERAMIDMEGLKCEWRAQIWLTYEELLKYRYTDGVITPEILIVHTICHEIAHMVDAMENDDDNGRSSHDSIFYAVLQRFYDDGSYEWLRDDFRQRLGQIGIKSLREVCILDQPYEVPLGRDDVNVGDCVMLFMNNLPEKPWKGVVIKKGPKRALVAVGKSPSWPSLPTGLEREKLAEKARHTCDRQGYIHYEGLMRSA